ncbi:MAG: DUF4430 domain-containing protein [Lachnospiraceae bacterium]|nr:DUF4430 domain-containing protein [Lachnospiraceae bacterium]
MKTNFKKKVVSHILCTVLAVAMAVSIAGCNSSPENETPPASTSNENAASDASVLGEGSTRFIFAVTDLDGNLTEYEIHTDKETVGAALLELGLIAGDDSEFGLYVKTVNDITVDYDKDGKYWAFYIDGEYATTGVDSTPITDGASYAFKVE